jgi:hypothetical protein
MDKAILDNTRQNAARPDPQPSFIEGDPASRLCASNSTRIARKICRRACRRSKRTCGRRSSAITIIPRPTRRAGSHLEPAEAALGLSMAMKEDAKSISFVEDTAVAPEKTQRIHRPFLEIIAGTKPPRAFTRTPPSAACTCARSST